MGAVHESISPELQSFIEAQHVFFVATAPLEAGDLQELNKERAVQEAKGAALRREAKLVRQELPVPRYGGVQRIIDAEGAPLLPAAGATGNGV